ncbi:c-type cytochrome [Bdellovibrio svalbardensis]|uniref:Cytochrome c domain-containing protein n=1 Tax=Bdellovibrio svalbardensis TaxID=2972972 RepID=A0ABT6DML6_9BACT|nr:hypothetical protein [Bdellovibrio svalbardensis]MDG0818112.1 hypothetical protein [Bdellovibrio svalbardensis]
MSSGFKTISVILFVLGSSVSATADIVDWSPSARIPEQGRANILNLDQGQLEQYRDAGLIHAQIYPVTVTGVLPPLQPVRNFIEDRSWNPLKELLNKVIRNITGFTSFDGFLSRLGLHKYPKATDAGVYAVPYPEGSRPDYRMGFGVIERGGAQGFTFSCAACHSSELFGKTVLGLTNRFPRANEFFVKAKKITGYYNSWFFQHWTGASQSEAALMDEAVRNLGRVEVKNPIMVGLDTSLAQVALSLNRRQQDAYATPSPALERNPRKDPFLDDYPADSKPAVWWNLKYKNRWLSDGSVISGNPIFTNIIWNEVGRGADLRVLENWLSQNQQVVDELTAAVFSAEAPRITDFFPAERIDVGRAKIGEQIFNNTCAQCHGVYEKAWSLPGSETWPKEMQLRTTKVIPRRDTPVEEVGTDPYRRLGMKSLEQLNNLSISRKNGIVIQAQPGYVPPPLVGIWARWPYMHNNSIPSLCAVLTPAKQRPQVYYAGEARDKEKDFDFECNGYPLGPKTPAAWKEDDFLYVTTRRGMSNAGHDEGIFLEQGREILSVQDKKDLIQYLQTL